MQIPQKHHYIPQFWTKNWVGLDGKAQQYSNPHKSIITSLRKHPASIGWMKKLYDFPTHNNETIDFETLLFRRVDQRASDLFKKLKNDADPTLTTLQVEDLSIFLLTLMHRSPAGIFAMRKLSKVMFEDVRKELRASYGDFRTDDDPPTVEEYEAQRGPEAYLDHFSSVFRTVVFSKRIVKFLSSLHWKRVIFDVPDRRLMLSDDPLIRTNGLAGTEGHVALPITPSIAIVGCNKSKYFDTIFSRNQRVLIGNMNDQVVESARHFVVDVDERQVRFVRNHFGRKHRPTLSEASLGDYAEDLTAKATRLTDSKSDYLIAPITLIPTT